MKMLPEHYTVLKKACDAVLRERPTMRAVYAEKRRSNQRFMWDVLGAAHLPDGQRLWLWISDTLYPYLNDSHIETALKAITKETP